MVTNFSMASHWWTLLGLVIETWCLRRPKY